MTQSILTSFNYVILGNSKIMVKYNDLIQVLASLNFTEPATNIGGDTKFSNQEREERHIKILLKWHFFF